MPISVNFMHILIWGFGFIGVSGFVFDPAIDVWFLVDFSIYELIICPFRSLSFPETPKSRSRVTLVDRSTCLKVHVFFSDPTAAEGGDFKLNLTTEVIAEITSIIQKELYDFIIF